MTAAAAELGLFYLGLFAAAFAAGHAWWRPRAPRLTGLALAAAFVALGFAHAGLVAFGVLVGGFAWASWCWRHAPGL